ncbi:siphovirus Gp157 family protein [Vibrio harveyi]|uniref:siphovirus Gp157 family protein n=1 Tax=Vibrio harveyi TaxID=669 RepID=UPI00165DE920|nr:siphovirus Gp157 family protein [Vibrio harveyi]
MANIYEIAEERKELFKLLEENEWDISVIQDTLDGDGFDEKVNDWIRVIANNERNSEMLKAESKTLTERAKQFDNNAKRMKKALHQVMQNLGHKTYKVTMGTLSRAEPKSVVKFDETKLSDDYIIIDTVKSADKQKIETDMKAGKDVPGAYYEMQEERFTIRKK